MILFFDSGEHKNIDYTGYFETVKKNMDEDEVVYVSIDDSIYYPDNWLRICRQLEEAASIVLMSGLCADALPEEVIRLLEKIELAVIGGECISAKFYTILNTEGVDGEKSMPAMTILHQFCKNANIDWGRGLGIGSSRQINSGSLVYLPFLNLIHRRRLGMLKRLLEISIWEQSVFIKEHIQGIDDYVDTEKMMISVKCRHNIWKKQEKIIA